MSPVMFNPIQSSPSTTVVQSSNSEEKPGIARRFWEGVKYNAKYTAGFWTGKPTSEVTGGDVAATTIIAAAPYLLFFGIGGCAPELGETGGNTGKTSSPGDFKFVAGEGMLEPIIETLEGTTHPIYFNFEIHGNLLENTDNIWVKLGTENINTAPGLINELNSCSADYYEGCYTKSCRILWSGKQVIGTEAAGQNVLALDDDNLSVMFSNPLGVRPGSRDVLVFEYKDQPYTHKYIGLVGETDVPPLNIFEPGAGFTTYDFSGDSPDPTAPARSRVYLMDSQNAICNFGRAELENLTVAVPGAIAVDWKTLSADGASLSDTLPTSLPIIIDSIKVTNIVEPGKSTWISDVEGEGMGDFDDNGEFVMNLFANQDIYDWVKGENGFNYMQVKVEVYAHINTKDILDPDVKHAYYLKGIVNE